ncbi:MAG: hypothetical protein WC196_01875 [Bacilli bacterium]|jgi:t-SNARE complex subunit (syntaxin)|nr:hypothetical protein [Bacilli bacterium]MDD3422030.1 hypothetical protein [Bacilli bacterium]MDD4065650.1 hypothetical protein [Bacilli bacterium]
MKTEQYQVNKTPEDPKKVRKEQLKRIWSYIITLIVIVIIFFMFFRSMVIGDDSSSSGQAIINIFNFI